MSNNFISALEEQFNKDCKVINIRYEYEGYSGTERYIIASCLTEKEIWNKYPKQEKLYAPFVRVDLSFIEVRQKYINNEDKFCKRAKRTQDIFNFDETTAVFHKELLVNDFVLERINEEKECEVLSTLYKAFDTLTEKQKSRVVKYYVKDKTLRDIAEEENVKYQTISESLEEANKYHTGKAGGFITALKGHFTSTPLKRYRRS